jgi:predicted TIM-barrel fold metal-dependent hydrolase
MQVDEERFQHPAIRVPAVPPAAMAGLARRAPGLTLVLNSLKVEHALEMLATGPLPQGVFLDVNAMDMPFDGLATLVRKPGAPRLVFGSQMPFLYPEAALMVVRHAGLRPEETEAILEDNWRASPVLARAAGGS